MFTITSARLVGLITVVCAVVVAPQALAAPNTHCGIAAPAAAQGYDLCGFDLSDLDSIPGYKQQQEYLTGLTLAAERQSPLGQPANNTPGGIVPAYVANTSQSGNSVVLANGASESGTAAVFVYTPTNPGWGAAATAAKKSAAKPAVNSPRIPVLCNGQTEYEYVWKGCEG